MARTMVRRAGAALALWGSLGVATAAHAQNELDDAHATVNRLLVGGGDLNIFTTGKVLDGVYSPIAAVRTVDRCQTQISARRPNHPDIPENYRNQSAEGDLEWGKVSKVQASGSRVYYDSFRANGQPFTYHFQLGSSDAAVRAAAAFSVLAKACSGPAEQDMAAENIVHDERGNIASLAIDRRDGSRYGWAIDYPTRGEADRRALDECNRTGAKCQIVLRFTGGCGAYAADQAKGSTAWGWGTNLRRGDAEARAQSEARRRGGSNVVTRVWGCNSVNNAPTRASAPAAASAPTAVQDSAEEAQVADLNRRANERDREARERLERSKQAQAEYERKLKEVAAAGDEYTRAKAEHEAQLAKARAAAEEYRLRKEAYEKELASGKYKTP